MLRIRNKSSTSLSMMESLTKKHHTSELSTLISLLKEVLIRTEMKASSQIGSTFAMHPLETIKESTL